MSSWVNGKSEIEVTDLILQLKQKLSELKGAQGFHIIVFVLTKIKKKIRKDKNKTKLHYNILNQMELLISNIFRLTI